MVHEIRPQVQASQYVFKYTSYCFSKENNLFRVSWQIILQTLWKKISLLQPEHDHWLDIDENDC